MIDVLPYRQKRYVLVVDDSMLVRSLLRQHLEEIGMQVCEAADGEQALEQALAEDFDLVITDVDMPKLDGLELCRRLKDSPQTRHIPVIMLSVLDTDADIEQGFLAGASTYISKTESKENIFESIERVLSKAAKQREQLIMVVDDSLTIRTVVEKGLKEVGFKVVVAANGAEAMERIKQATPDLILCDIDMPVMNGEEFCRAVHADLRLATIPFVVMSANNDRPIMRRMLHFGADTYLVKPFNIDQLVIIVEKLLSDRVLILSKEKESLEMERNLILASIASLCCALEARDAYTRGHSEQVAEIAAQIATHMNIGPEDVEVIKLGGRLHDIGKIGILDNVLLKPGRLSDEEFAMIRRHPVIGAEILQPVPSLSRIIPLVLHHHERIDGRGYPDNLKGSAIPLWARITAVGDTFHALISDRPYRKGLPLDDALAIIRDCRGTQLCPESVDVFLENKIWEKTKILQAHTSPPSLNLQGR